MNLGNCPRCGKLYAKNYRDVCPACIQEIDRQYDTCAAYLRKNRGCTTHELSEETGVSIKQISKFIREGRISLIDAPNMSYPCEACGTLIRENNLCLDCRGRLAKDMKISQEQDRVREQAANRTGGGAYQIGDRLKDL